MCTVRLEPFTLQMPFLSPNQQHQSISPIAGCISLHPEVAYHGDLSYSMKREAVIKNSEIK